MKKILATAAMVLAIAIPSFACGEDGVKLPPITFKGNAAYYRICEGKKCKLERVRVECDSCPNGTVSDANGLCNRNGEDDKRQAARKAEADLCNTFPRNSKMYRACWCNSTLSGSWREQLCGR